MRGIFGFAALLCGFFFLFSFRLLGSNGYVVYLKDKGKQHFDPQTFFHPNAICKKKLNGLDPSDVQEWPVCKSYLDQLIQHSDSVMGESRWMNAVLLYTTDSVGIANLPFVQRMEFCRRYDQRDHLTDRMARIKNISDAELLRLQTGAMEDSVFRARGIRGKGIRVAVFDAGFRNADHFEGLQHLFERGQVEQTIDFPARGKNVFNNHYHGTAVLTCLAGKFEGVETGLAGEARFLLARTEYSSREPLREEFFWLMGAEWADRHGADIISSSLGYTQQRYFYRDMDGKTSLVSRAAGMAVRRGITVVNSAGNEGSNDWKYIITPADNDSVIAVGGLDPETGYVINFSSLGPGYAGQLKPNVIASGKVFAGKGNGWGEINGTSFSCPLVSGFVACMMSEDTLLKHYPMRLMQRLHESAHLYPYFDYAHGYGIPKASRFLQPSELLQELPFRSEISNFRISLDAPEESPDVIGLRVGAKAFLPKGKVSLPAGWYPLLYLSAFDERGKMLNFQVCRLSEEEIGKETVLNFVVPYGSQSIRFHYQGTTLNKSLR